MALLAIATPAALPMLLPGKYYLSDDGFLHLFRLFSFDRELRQGVMYPRWLPEFAFGYGLPVLDFYAPFLYYVAETIHLLGWSLADAIKLTSASSILIAAAGAYLLGAEFFRATASPKMGGLLTAAGFVYFPYFILDIYVRGAFAEALATAILPWFIWSMLRSLRQAVLAPLILCALFFAALMFSHNMVIYFATPLAGALLFWETRFVPATRLIGALLRIGAAFLLGLALTAIYWLPSMAELRYVWLSRWIQDGSALYEDFVSLQKVIQFSFPFQFTDHPFPLSVAPMVFGAISLLAALIATRDKKLRGNLLIVGAMVLTESVLFADFTMPFWLGVPFINGIQFPWRLSIFIGLGIAICIGSAGSILLPRLFSARLTRPFSFGVVVLIAGILGWNGIGDLALKRTYGPSGDSTIGQIARNEVNIGLLGFSVQREYLPLTVQAIRERINSPRYEKTTPSLHLEEYSSLRQAFTISAQDPISISLRSFDFPGWQAYVDGQPVSTYPTPPIGLVTMDMPSGTHRIDFAFEDTLPRQIGAFISGMAALVVCALTARLAIKRKPESLPTAGLVTAFTMFIAIPSSIALTAPKVAWQPVAVDVSPELRLIGWRVEKADLQSSIFQVADARQALELEVIWQVKQPLEDKPFVWQFVDESGRVWAQREQRARYGTGYAGAWLPNEIVRDHSNLPFALAVPPGKYKVQVAYAKGQSVPVGEVILERGSAPSEPELFIEHPSNAQVGDDFRFLGYNSVNTANAGAALPITLFWQAERQVDEDYTVFVQLIDNRGERVAQSDSVTDGIYPMSLWPPKSTVIDRRDILLPRRLDPGLYYLVAGIYGTPSNPQRLPVITEEGPSPDDVLKLGAVKIQMNVQSARPQYLQNSLLGSTIRLVGYDLAISSDRAELKLYWQAIAAPGENYKVFVHLVDDSGLIVTQQDHIPAQGRYPTQIWDSGEQVIDPYLFPLRNLNPGRYRIMVGMYSPETGERLIALDANGREWTSRGIETGSFSAGAR